MAKQPNGRRKKTAGFLPEGAVALIHRWVVQTVGLSVVCLAFALAAALATYDPQDQSFNTAATHPASNMLGGFGAALADLLLQAFGLAAWLPVMALLTWGCRLLGAAEWFDRLWLRVLLLLSGTLLVSIGLAAVPIPSLLHLPSSAEYLGGSVGKVLLGGLSETLRPFGVVAFAWVLALLSGGLGLLCAFLAFGLSWQEWGVVIRSFTDRIKGIHAAGTSIGVKLSSLGNRLDNEESPRRRASDRGKGERAAGNKASGDRVWREPKLGGSVYEPDDEDEEESDEAFVAPIASPRRSAEPLVAPRAERAHLSRRAEDGRQGKLHLPDEAVFDLPPTELLSLPPQGKGPVINQEGLEQNARLLVSVLDDFGVNGEIVKVRPGPVVTLYELEPAAGTKTSRVIGLSDDIARSMSALSVRIATVPGRNVIGIELPNAKRETVYLRELLDSDAFERAPSKLTLVLGKDIGGQPVMVDLTRMPHLLIAGTTGSGKSVAINTMILSLLYKLRPEECRLIMIDPKMLELSVYDGIPHLLAPVVTEPGKAVVALKWAVREMEDRYRAMSQLGVRNIAGYNHRLVEAKAKGESLSRTVQTGFDPDTGKPVYEDQALALEPLPYIVVVVDEMADLMLVAGKDIEAAVQRLAQMARAAGIHLIMATQRPSVDVITGTIKANFPSRVSFQVSSKIDSRTILGEQGAEQLLGQGDMLYMASGGRITRVHGPFVSDEEVEAVVDHLRNQGEPHYVESVTEEEDAPEAELGGRGDSGDGLYDQAVALVAREGKASTSFIQRHLQIGYNRAARIIEKMEQEGVVSKANHVGKREVLVRGHGD